MTLTDADSALAIVISEKVDAAMTARGLSLRRLAKASGLSRQAVLNVTKARSAVTTRSLLAMATALGCDLEINLIPRDVA